MGSSGDGPKPWRQAEARTVFLRVPYSEYAQVIAGRKSEFRASPRACSQLWSVEPPLPVVAYAIFPSRGYRGELMLLQGMWREPLGAISAESLERERQPDMAHFRRYWMKREKTAFKPTRMVSVFRVRPWSEHDRDEMAFKLLYRLYGEHLPRLPR